MEKIGFVGLGTMGMPMARNLQKAGYSLVVYNRTAERTRDFVGQANVKIVDSPAEVAENCEILFTMLAADDAVEEVILGEKGVLSAAEAGLTVVDSSTVAPQTSLRMAEELAKKEIDFLDAPVTGSKPQATEGILTFMVGGRAEVFERCLPLFQAMGKHAYHMGAQGAGSQAKLGNNTMAAIHLLAMTEALTMVSKAGVDPALFLEMVSGGGGRSGMVDTKGPKVVNRDFRPHFKTELMLKDLGLATSFANELAIPTPVLATVKEMLQIAMTKGFAQEDMCSVIKCYEEWAGIEVKARDLKI
ncbi:hypothetical protein BEP19_03780 [Ammoniphilus oxalaticus]|uniref:2-hydroxy-3-oxopropionate reductase n=2 Tax=Ammoniphilus oxalaticus TaxID=66863 RepID=A0A419SLS2_9BACL|nr:NAD(P)-dependent oxidoreductase [Ammoniphilus oxalaticus]RKD24966.1 hypothetical protein BEP19_03780 [Ammoniphilus oxalaticus]